MSTAVLYSFTDINFSPKVREPIHLVFHSDHFPQTVPHVLQELASVAQEIWRGGEPELNRLRLRHVDYVLRKETREEASLYRRIPWRYEISMAEGRIVSWREFQHVPQGMEEYTIALKEAQKRVADVLANIESAARGPAYKATGHGDLDDLKKVTASK